MYVFDSLLIIGILLRGTYSVRLIGSKVIQPNFKVDKQTKKKTQPIPKGELILKTSLKMTRSYGSLEATYKEIMLRSVAQDFCTRRPG